MEKQITVKELREQLERLEAAGMGDFFVWYRDVDSIDWKMEQGLFDVCQKDKSIALA